MVKNSSHPGSMFPAEVKQDNALLSCFGSHTVSKDPFGGLFNAIFFAFLCFISFFGDSAV